MSTGGDRLLAVLPWGRVALSEGAEAGSATVVSTIVAVAGADVHGALGLAKRWQGLHDSTMPTLLRCAVRDDILELRHAACVGSTVQELVAAFGSLNERQCAALYFDLIIGVRRCHSRRLVVGGLHAGALYVCPPGLEGVPALTCHGAGLPLLVAAARGSLGQLGSEGYRALLGASQDVAPGVCAGRLPSSASDTWSLAAAMIFTLLGKPAFPAEKPDLLLHAQRQGLGADNVRQLVRVAPTLAPSLLQALSPTPLLRAGSLAALEDACRALDGARVSLAADGGPWQIGSPLMALGAYAGATPFADRFAYRAPLTVVARPDLADNPELDMDRARLNVALRQLDVRRTLSQRDQVRKERTGLKVAVVLLTVAIAAAIVWFGGRARPSQRLPLGVAPAALRLMRAAPPRPIRSIPLFRKGDGPNRE